MTPLLRLHPSKREVTVTPEQAREAERSRPDLLTTEEGQRALANAWKVGPAAVAAICRNHPTQEEFEQAKLADERALRLSECRKQAARALDAKRVLEGKVKHARGIEGDVRIVIGPHLKDVLLLAEWAEDEQRGATKPPPNWIEIRTVAERVAVIDVLVRTSSMIASSLAESHARKERRRSK